MKEELIGLTELEEVVVKCGDCSEPLVEVVLTENNESRATRYLKPFKTKFKVVECPKCKGSSFETKVFEGSTVVGAIKENYIVDSVDVTIDDDNVVLNVLKLVEK